MLKAIEKFCAARLTERYDISETLAVFKFKTEDQLAFIAGQYATLAIDVGEELVERPYSIASSPYEHFLEFFVELVPTGQFTPKLWELTPGSDILIRRRIVGRFTLDRSVNRHLFLATVTGVAPFVSILRTQLTQRERGAAANDQFVLIHGASHSRELGPFLGELEELSRDGWLTYIPTISRPWEELEWPGETGRVEDLLRKHADQHGFDHTHTVGYACGHPQMVENCKSVLTRARFSEDKLREEEYFVMADAEARSADPIPSIIRDVSGVTTM